MITYMLLIVLVEAITEILVDSQIFSKPRELIYTNSSFFGELVTCGYCTSVWVSAAVAWMAVLSLSPYFMVNYIVTVMVLHRLSNVWHEAIKKWLNRHPITFSIHKTESVLLGGHDEPTE